MMRWLALGMAILQLAGVDWDSARATMAMRTGVLLRLHVVAASDEAEDQRIKLCVRDAVREAYAAGPGAGEPMLLRAQRMLPALREAAQAAAKAEGFRGGVTVELEQVAFEARTLDGLTFPAGIYPALMVRLGPAQGHNWWGLVDSELALNAARVDGLFAQPEEQGEAVRWVWLLPRLWAQLFGGEVGM